MSRNRIPWRGLLPVLLAAAACGDGPEPPPIPSYVLISPDQALLAPGDSILPQIRVFSVEDAVIDSEVELRSDDPTVVAVTPTGWLRAVSVGTTRVVAREPGGIRGIANLSVGWITGITPQGSPPGGVLTVTGANFGQLSRLFFSGVPAITRSVAPDGRSFESWVPWDVRSGPVTVVLADGNRFDAPEPFFLTGGGDDALEPNSFDTPVEVSVPFRNPYLVSKIRSMDHFAFEVPRPMPLTVRVVDRESPNTWQLRLTLQVNRQEGFGEVMGIMPAFAFGPDQPVDGVISRAAFPPGRYSARVFVAPGFDVVDRRFEFVLDTIPAFARPPDALEPNDFPLEAPEIPLPFVDTLAIENPWAVDYYTIRIAERSRIRIRMSHGSGSMALFFFQDDRSVQWNLTNGERPRVWIGTIGPFSPLALDCTEEPGVYRIGVLENDGRAPSYVLDVSAAPTNSSFFDCRQPQLGVGEGLRAVGASSN